MPDAKAVQQSCQPSVEFLSCSKYCSACNIRKRDVVPVCMNDVVSVCMNDVVSVCINDVVSVAEPGRSTLYLSTSVLKYNL